MSKIPFENAPFEYALRKTYLEYLTENNLNTDSGIIPFSYIEIMKIFYEIGEHYEYYVESNCKDLTNYQIPRRKLKKELSNYETTVYKNMHKFCKEFIKLFVNKYKDLPEYEKNNRKGYKKALPSSEEFINICIDIESEQI